MSCPHQNCRYRNDDALCKEVYTNCRIYNQWQYQQARQREAAAELERIHQENDVYLAQLINNQQVRESGNTPQRSDNAPLRPLPSLTSADNGIGRHCRGGVETPSAHFKKEPWTWGKDV